MKQRTLQATKLQELRLTISGLDCLQDVNNTSSIAVTCITEPEFTSSIRIISNIILLQVGCRERKRKWGRRYQDDPWLLDPGGPGRKCLSSTNTSGTSTPSFFPYVSFADSITDCTASRSCSRQRNWTDGSFNLNKPCSIPVVSMT